ncbi:MAG: sigma-70 family RNA polymerase sigma factor [Gammaproteobacteria bacterium]|nr:sigma-70 family RNA polymerase sigma factor [Gammaproteobacteria bacterium]MDH5618982.1 sigma-70 family RNA polymerase sigma factor [Gammaproteobacteria bacterium]
MTPIRLGNTGNEEGAAEAVLLRRVAAGDRGAFEELFENYYSRLFAFLFRLTRAHGAAEELANDVMLTLWKDAGRFRGESKVSTWIFGIAYRQALAYLKKRRLSFVSIKDGDAMVGETDAQFEREDWVRQGIQALPPKQKLTVMLVYFLGLSCEETASASGVPVNTVKTRMFHARKNMKEYLTASGTPEDWQKDLSDD